MVVKFNQIFAKLRLTTTFLDRAREQSALSVECLPSIQIMKPEFGCIKDGSAQSYAQ
jgi:hypothetical protein